MTFVTAHPQPSIPAPFSQPRGYTCTRAGRLSEFPPLSSPACLEMRHSFLLLLPEVPMTRPFVRKALIRSAVVIFAVVLILLTPRLAAAEAQNRLTILYNFTNGSDGGHPGSGGLLYLKGSLYGTAMY